MSAGDHETWRDWSNGAVWFGGKFKLIFVDEHLNGPKYCQILMKGLFTSKVTKVWKELQ